MLKLLVGILVFEEFLGCWHPVEGGQTTQRQSSGSTIATESPYKIREAQILEHKLGRLIADTHQRVNNPSMCKSANRRTNA